MEDLSTDSFTGSTLATAVVGYFRSLSVDLERNQLLSGLPVSEGRLTEELLPRAVKRFEHIVTWQNTGVKGLATPCCVQLNDDSYAVVMEKTKSEIVVLDPLDLSAVRRLKLKEFEKTFSRRSFRIMPSLALLQQKHSVGKHWFHWFWARLLSKPGVLLDITVSSLFANILAVVTALFVMQVYDRVIPGQSESTLWVLAAGVGIAILFEALLRVSRAKVVDRMGKEAEIDISAELASRVLGMKYNKQPAPPNMIVHSVREFSAVKEFFTTASVGVVADLPFVFVFLALIYGMAGNVVWVIIAGAALIIIPSLLVQGKMARLSKESMGGMASASRLLTEAVYGLETVKVTRSQPFFQRQWEEIIALNAVKTTEQRSISAALTYWATSMQQSTYVFAVIAGVYMIFAGDFTTGSILAVSILSTRTLGPISQLSQVFSRWQNMKVALQSIDMIMKAELERDPGRSYIRKARLIGKIEVKDVQFAHQNAKYASLHVKSLIIEPGTRLALLGPNGSGKSTLLRLMSGLFEPVSGELLIDGVDIRQIDADDIRQNIGYLPQEVRMFRGTLRENLTGSGVACSDDLLMEALDFGGLGHFVRQHPDGLDLTVVDGGDGLSIGQRQSIGLTRLFLQDPAIILLDEPTSALDQALEVEVVNKLGEWIASRTCIIATHRPQILSQVSRIVILQHGKIVLDDEREAALKQITKPAAQQQKPILSEVRPR